MARAPSPEQLQQAVSSLRHILLVVEVLAAAEPEEAHRLLVDALGRAMGRLTPKK